MSYEFTAPVKDPAAVLDYGIDWSDWLDEGETIVGLPSVLAEPVGLIITAVEHAENVVSWRVGGGQLGQSYIISCRINTSIGRIDERSMRLPVGDR